jgi:SnoaL-like domain
MSSITLPPPIQTFFDATNTENRAAFLSAFAPDGIVDDWGREFHGREAIGRWSDDENIGAHSRFAVTDVTSPTPDTYVVTATVSGGGFNGPSHFTFTLSTNQITRMTITA